MLTIMYYLIITVVIKIYAISCVSNYLKMAINIQELFQ